MERDGTARTGVNCGGGERLHEEVVRVGTSITAMRVLQVGRRRRACPGDADAGTGGRPGPVGRRERPWVPRKATRTATRRAWEPDFRSGAASLENVYQRSLSFSLPLSLFPSSLSLFHRADFHVWPNALIGYPPVGRENEK